MIESIEKLRGWETSVLVEEGGVTTIGKMCDEIEAEVERDYMRLPEDADGVPIHCGERMMLDNGHEGDVWLIGVFDIMMSDHTCFDWAKSRHVKPRTIESVLRDMLDAYDSGERGETPYSLIADCADEIRELMGGDA